MSLPSNSTDRAKGLKIREDLGNWVIVEVRKPPIKVPVANHHQGPSVLCRGSWLGILAADSVRKAGLSCPAGLPVSIYLYVFTKISCQTQKKSKWLEIKC